MYSSIVLIVLSITTNLIVGQTLCPIQTVCSNGGTCYSNGNVLTCACRTGFTGVFCDTATAVTPATTTTTVPSSYILCPNQATCQNSGICYIVANSVKCVCPEGFTGQLCEIKTTVTVNGCSPNPCANGGICYTQASGAFSSCSCSSGFSGTYCQTSSGTGTGTGTINCNLNPCKNGGVCTSTACICGSGYSGQYCETLLTNTLCQNIYCKNSGVCNIVSLTMAECYCPTGYGGYYCELLNVGNRCSQVQCLNGGTCEERQPGSISYAYCFCKAGYTGSRCETQYFSCTTNGRFTDAYGCDTSRYLECSNNVLYRRDCSPGLRYNPTAGRCDYAANVRC